MNTALKITALVVLCLFFSHAFAQYEIRKHSVSNGGGTLSGERIELSATIGQPDAGLELTNGNYALRGGFWHKNTDLIYRDEFE